MCLIICTDESGINERYRAIGAVSGLDKDMDELSIKLKKLLEFSKVNEIKFANIKTHKPKILCAKEFIKAGIDFASSKKIRIDVLIWDINDSRHNVYKRNDKENLERMYFHLLRHILRTWNLYTIKWYPDEQTEYDFDKIAMYIKTIKDIRKTKDKKPYIFELFNNEKININILEVIEQNSEFNPIIQLSDLFAGFARYSIENSEKYKNWKKNNYEKNNIFLFNFNQKENEEENQSLLNRLELINFIAKYCKEKNIEVSINTNNYLKTFNPLININFWHYESQGEYDKAPTKYN